MEKLGEPLEELHDLIYVSQISLAVVGRIEC